jgi:hypothetical protein
MNKELFDRLNTLIQQGRKKEVKPILDEFILSFKDDDEKVKWTREYLEKGEYGDKIRHELYEKIIFPVLHKGYLQSDPWSLKWLGKTIYNIYGARKLSQLIDDKSDVQLLKEAYRLNMNDTDITSSLLSSIIRGLDFAFHEWPSGILFSSNSEPLQECDLVESEIALAQRLDIGNKYTARYEEWSGWLQEEREKIMKKNEKAGEI